MPRVDEVVDDCDVDVDVNGLGIAFSSRKLWQDFVEGAHRQTAFSFSPTFAPKRQQSEGWLQEDSLHDGFCNMACLSLQTVQGLRLAVRYSTDFNPTSALAFLADLNQILCILSP